MREITLKQVLSDAQLAALDNQFLSPAHVIEPITTSTIGRTADGQTRFVFARNAINSTVRDLAETNIGRTGYSAKQSNRAAVRGQEGTEALWGFMEASKLRPEAEMTALTAKYIEKFIVSMPFFTAVAEEFQRYWPEAYAIQQRLAQTAQEFVIPETIFSTLVLNSDAAAGLCWYPRQKKPFRICQITALGFPMRFLGRVK